MIDATFAQSLIESEDVLDVIFQEMLSIATPESYPDDLLAHYENTEEALNALECFLYDAFYESYDELLERCQERSQQDAAKVSANLFDRCQLVLIADALSLREAALLKVWMENEPEIEIKDVSFLPAPFPAITETLSIQLLGTISPAQGSNTEFFSYQYVAGVAQTPTLPKTGNLLIWLRLPDILLEKVTMAQNNTVADAFEKARDKIKSLFLTSGRDELLITSDHGYLYGRSANQIMPMQTALLTACRRVFPHSKRYQAMTVENEARIKPYEWREPERRAFVFTDTHIVLRSRYWWGTESPNDRCVAHGGLSFVEGLVPMLHLRRK
ncbi:MAG: hypothetical protein ACE5PV_12235 [Candidatus Poribacteria bacterium]